VPVAAWAMAGSRPELGPRRGEQLGVRDALPQLVPSSCSNCARCGIDGEFWMPGICPGTTRDHPLPLSWQVASSRLAEQGPLCCRLGLGAASAAAVPCRLICSCWPAAPALS